MARLVVSGFVEALEACLPSGRRPIGLHEPDFSGREWEYVKECLDTGWVSSAGRFVDRFESDLATYSGAPHVVATVNGTAALHTALMLAGVIPGDEVLVPALTFVATANAVAHCGAVPHFADSERETLGLDPDALEAHLAAIAVTREGRTTNSRTGARIRACVPMHTFGHPVRVERLLAVCAARGIEVVEDAAEAIGSFRAGRHAGTFGRCGILSFNGNKTVTTGGGGAILTADADLAARAKHLTTTARLPHRWEFIHDAVGYNYRMPNLNAALGVAQMEALPAMLARKRALADRLRSRLAGLPGVSFVDEPPSCRSNYWLNAVLLDPDSADLRDEVLAATADRGLMTRPCWTLMHRLPMYRACPRAALPVAEDLAARLVNLPSSASL